MQITQGASLDTLQLLSSREALQAFKVGQIIKVSVIEGTPPKQGGGRALLEIAGRQHEVRSLVPLSSGQKLMARLQLAGDRVLLQPVETETVSGTEPVKSLAAQAPTDPAKLPPLALRNLLPRAQPVQHVVELARAISQHPQFQELPRNLRDVLMRLVESRPDSPRPDASLLRQAIERSGLFLENRLAQEAEPRPQALQHDLKGLLFRLLQSLDKAGLTLKKITSTPETALFLDLPKPTGSSPEVAHQPFTLPARLKPEALDQPLETLLKQLFQLADGALAKTTMQQLQHLSRPGSSLQVDIPWITPWATIPVHLEIEPDNKRTSKEEENHPSRWQIRLELELPRLGRIQANLLLEEQRLGTQCWCERPQSQALLQQYESHFQQRIHQLGLQMEPLVFTSRPMVDDQKPIPANSRLLDVRA